jgi:hypothetical protein
MSENKQRPIILNHMFTGGYLGDNIGHEIINLFKADDGNNYIYLCKDGKYTRKDLPKYVIQVRHHCTRTLEVISIAEIESKITKQEIDNIKYGGVSIVDIFKENEEQGTDTYITFKATNVIKPTPDQPVYIAYEGNRVKVNISTPFIKPTIILNEKVVVNGKEKYNFDVCEALRNYIYYNENQDSDYFKLNSLIKNAFSNNIDWQPVSEQLGLTVKDSSKIYATPGDIYGISNLELPYSNAFKFFIEKYPQLLSGIFGKICSYFDMHRNYQITRIEREWRNIDILIEVDNELVIVIENKIFSDLNGKKENEITQLDKYERIITKEDKYNAYNKIFILLLPDHNNINIDNYTNWHKLFYSSVSSYLDEFVKTNNDEQLKDFAEMVSRHSDKDYNYSVMKRRFERALIKAKSIIEN